MTPIMGERKQDFHSLIKFISKSYLCLNHLFNVSLMTSTATSLLRLQFKRFMANDGQFTHIPAKTSLLNPCNLFYTKRASSLIEFQKGRIFTFTTKSLIFVCNRPFSYSGKEPGSIVIFIHFYTRGSIEWR